MNHRIRLAIGQYMFDGFKDNDGSGTFEIDEIYVGDKEKNKHKKVKGTQGRSTLTKTAVIGLLKRKGSVMAKTF